MNNFNIHLLLTYNMNSISSRNIIEQFISNSKTLRQMFHENLSQFGWIFEIRQFMQSCRLVGWCVYRFDTLSQSQHNSSESISDLRRINAVCLPQNEKVKKKKIRCKHNTTQICESIGKILPKQYWCRHLGYQ